MPLKPIPNDAPRRTLANRLRDTAKALADQTPAVPQTNNGEADAALDQDGPAIAAHGTFTKGLAHDEYGRVMRDDLAALVSEINQDANGQNYAESPFPGVYCAQSSTSAFKGRTAPFAAPLFQGAWKVPEGQTGTNDTARSWESPLAGHSFDMQGLDPDQVGMPPAPALGSPELTAEMAEVYAAALVRDVPFGDWDSDATITKVVDALKTLDFFQAGETAAAEKRRKARFGEGETAISSNNLFRGSTPGAQKGPYVSQFMLIGNREQGANDAAFPAAAASALQVSQDALLRSPSFVPTDLKGAGTERAGVEDGYIRYGLQVIPQRFRPHQEKIDHLTEWNLWLDVQNGANRKEAFDLYLTKDGAAGSEPISRFAMTPRDLASYVHFDQLYQAYLNACLLMLGMGISTDTGLPEGKGHPTRDGFALFGGPHALTLVTEVATRALKAVRRQKYQIHLRARPEAVAAAIAMEWEGSFDAELGPQEPALEAMRTALDDAGLLPMIAAHNKDMNAFWSGKGWPIQIGPNGDGTEDRNALIPMAFPEGSPMHPAYGAGHATVAGACVTVLKAFFEMFEGVDLRGDETSICDWLKAQPDFDDIAHLFATERLLVNPGKDPDAMDQIETAWEADPQQDGRELRAYGGADGDLSVQGELDKLAANIAIGRNFAAVHYYTDYYESLRMGERVTIAMLREQMLTYREPVSMRLISFDGDRILLLASGGTNGTDDTPVQIWDRDGAKVDYQDWLARHL